MVRKISLLLLAVGLTVFLPVSAEATGEGTIRVALNVGDLAVTNGAVTLYYVGYATEGGYQVTEEFGGGIVKEDDALSPHLAQWFAQLEDVSGVCQLLDADGNAVFSHLPEGLYLLVQTEKMDGFYPIRPTMVTIPCQGQTKVKVAPTLQPIIPEDSPATGEGPGILRAIAALVLSGLGLAVIYFRLRR